MEGNIQKWIPKRTQEKKLYLPYYPISNFLIWYKNKFSNVTTLRNSLCKYIYFLTCYNIWHLINVHGRSSNKLKLYIHIKWAREIIFSTLANLVYLTFGFCGVGVWLCVRTIQLTRKNINTGWNNVSSLKMFNKPYICCSGFKGNL
jgi:hypothetical protein